MNVAIIGASGYAGAELVKLLSCHPQINTLNLLVSEHSSSAHQRFSDLYPQMLGLCDFHLQPFSWQWLERHHQQLDAVFMATPHHYSQQWAHAFIELGICVFDLSGAFRLKQTADYRAYYDFDHQHPQLLEQAVYGLPEFADCELDNAELIALPGCYPTASLLSIKPLCQSGLLDNTQAVVINGISGASGAGRSPVLATSFNEVSLRAYNILSHRHQPEISQHAGNQDIEIVFNPHIAPFKRGLMTTTTVKLVSDATEELVDATFKQAYQQSVFVRLANQWPQIDNVALTPFADLHWQYEQQKRTLVVCCAIDNLLKGAASQAVQCFNMRFGYAMSTALIRGHYER
ncbi:N-acetyl-gamma-glutamyl-phosphate reductase [Thalassotalea ponticola]|uniref:N-acetyl-gamma-glutamyl-phosphate reductase n=1 Tax=Thalassotalea ponticola TaxID=1523392 RepID=UPI0025B33EFF|nr:N-acetyl-gamma-glutamyl-phosphate reductase [Thalassotalea ponticola]MDN3652861.1 N-acetyl-gamma-glutamyl-phosphate reductase [Thalassotalea ponticola]